MSSQLIGAPRGSLSVAVFPHGNLTKRADIVSDENGGRGERVVCVGRCIHHLFLVDSSAVFSPDSSCELLEQKSAFM